MDTFIANFEQFKLQKYFSYNLFQRGSCLIIHYALRYLYNYLIRVELSHAMHVDIIMTLTY